MVDRICRKSVRQPWTGYELTASPATRRRLEAVLSRTRSLVGPDSSHIFISPKEKPRGSLVWQHPGGGLAAIGRCVGGARLESLRWIHKEPRGLEPLTPCLQSRCTRPEISPNDCNCST